MGKPKFAFCKGKFRHTNQTRQWLLSWSMHVSSWINEKNLNVLVLRYEDMKLKPYETFTRAVHFLQLDVTPSAINQAIDYAHIDALQQQEAVIGFKEKPAYVKQFFRKGIVGDWKQTLSEQQIQKISRDHQEVMKTFGYLDTEGMPMI